MRQDYAADRHDEQSVDRNRWTLYKSVYRRAGAQLDSGPDFNSRGPPV